MIRGQATCGETRKKEEQWQASDEDPRESSFDRCALCRVAWVPREMLGLPAPICIEVLPKGIVGKCVKRWMGCTRPKQSFQIVASYGRGQAENSLSPSQLPPRSLDGDLLLPLLRQRQGQGPG